MYVPQPTMHGVVQWLDQRNVAYPGVLVQVSVPSI